MKGRTPTKANEARFGKLRDLGCIPCLLFRDEFTPPAIHHMDGKTKEGCHDLTIPLCINHHQTKCNVRVGQFPLWVSRHGDGRAAFEREYGTEQFLLEETNRRIDV